MIVLLWIHVAAVIVVMTVMVVVVVRVTAGIEEGQEVMTEEDHLQGQGQGHQEGPGQDLDHGAVTDETTGT